MQGLCERIPCLSVDLDYICEVLDCAWETENRHDSYVVKVVNTSSKTVGHLPKKISSTCPLFSGLLQGYWHSWVISRFSLKWCHNYIFIGCLKRVLSSMKDHFETANQTTIRRMFKLMVNRHFSHPHSIYTIIHVLPCRKSSLTQKLQQTNFWHMPDNDESFYRRLFGAIR